VPEELGPGAGDKEEYYPGLPQIATLDIGDPSYICSPQSTIVASVIVVVLLNLSLIGGFVFFYRLKRKSWVKTKEAEDPRPRRQDLPPPLPPHNPRHPGSGDVMFRNTYSDKNSTGRSSRFSDNPTVAGMARHH